MREEKNVEIALRELLHSCAETLSIASLMGCGVERHFLW